MKQPLVLIEVERVVKERVMGELLCWWTRQEDKKLYDDELQEAWVRPS